ncbi:uncharacterized protein LOC142910200 [Petromyzon marinus]|uniref:uncharacterized protein LOC142910200 n=1 Tax=Petromyzon marinus TaxID=7757 RepID=UPI003F6EA593
MAMRQLVSRLGLLFLLLLLLLLHLVTWCSSHAPASPLNVRVESRDLLTQLRWDPADVNSATSSVTYRVESKRYGRAHWRTVCAATTKTRCDVSSALRHPGDRYQLRVRATVSLSSPVAAPISLPWVVVEVLPLKTTVLSAPTVTVMLHKNATVEEEGGDGGEEKEECGSEGEDEVYKDDDDGYDNDDYDDDDEGVGADGDGADGDGDDDEYYDDDDDDDEGEPKAWELSVGVSMRSGWRRRMAQCDVLYHLQAEVSTRRGVTSTERFVGCRYRHAVPPPGDKDEYCVRVRVVARYPRWKTGEWSPPSCVSVPPPHSAVATTTTTATTTTAATAATTATTTNATTTTAATTTITTTPSTSRSSPPSSAVSTGDEATLPASGSSIYPISLTVAMTVLTVLVLLPLLMCTVRGRRNAGERPGSHRRCRHHHRHHRRHRRCHRRRHHRGGAEIGTLGPRPRPRLTPPDESRSPSRRHTNHTARWLEDADHLAWHAGGRGFHPDP